MVIYIADEIFFDEHNTPRVDVLEFCHFLAASDIPVYLYGDIGICEEKVKNFAFLETVIKGIQQRVDSIQFISGLTPRPTIILDKHYPKQRFKHKGNVPCAYMVVENLDGLEAALNQVATKIRGKLQGEN